jgi:glycosyltransferase involved in cell wall biosynthesis
VDLAARLRVAGHGIDDSAAARAAAARHADAAAGPLLAVGRFADVKGTPLLFDVVRTVLAHAPDAAFVVAGGVPANRRRERQWLRRWRRDTPAALQERVRFSGWLTPPALAECYGAAHALVAPSRCETFGLVVLEAMLHGLPVAATAAGGVVELVQHGETGLLSPPGDGEALSRHALALATDAALARRLSRAAAAMVRGAHLWEHALPRLLAVYRELG